MFKIKLTQQYVSDKYLVNDITLLSTYISAHNKNKLQCIKCNNIWLSTWANYQNNNSGCPKCARKRTIKSFQYTTKIIENKLEKRNMTLLSEYKSSRSNILLGCNRCCFIWKSSHNSINYQKMGCPNCQFRYYDIQLKEIKNKIRLICIKCDHEWNVKFSNHKLNSGRYGCPICNNKYGKRENSCRKIFENLYDKSFYKIKHPNIRNPKTNRSLELDGYNEELQLAFEYQGEFHYPNTRGSSLYGKQHLLDTIERDRVKEIKCKELGIDLIKIPYWVNDLEIFIKTKIKELI